MANYQDLMSLFADTASAIREKNGSNATYYPNQMPAAIRALSTGGTTLNNQSLTVTPTSSTQTFTASGSVTGYTPVVVNAIPSSYIVPSGTYTVSNSDIGFPTDIKNYASLSVPVIQYNANFSASTTIGSSFINLINEDALIHILDIKNIKMSSYFKSSPGWVSHPIDAQNFNILIDGYYSLPSTSISKITPSTTSQTIPQYVWTLNEITVDAIPSSYIIPSGTSTITTNGTYDITSFASVSVAIPTGATINNYTAGAVTPTETSQTISVPTGYTGLNAVTVNAISSNYVGTGVPIGSIFTSTTSTAYKTFVNSGYFSQNIQDVMPAQSITTPSITISNTTGLITGIASASTSAYYSQHSKSGTLQLATQASATIIPSTTAQTAVSQYTWTTGEVTVAAIPVSTILSDAINGQAYLEATNNYAFSTTITIPEGYYSTTTITKSFSDILPALTTQAAASQVLATYQVYDGDGKIISGAMINNGTYNGTLNSVTTSITIPSGYHNGSGVISHTTVVIPAPTMTFNSTTGVLTASGNWTRGFTSNSTYTSTYSFTIRNAANLTTSGSTVTVPAGYYATQATKNVASATHSAPTLSLNSTTGVITATHTQTAGYVAAGTTSSTLALTTQAATTITPSTASQTAVAANRYTTGAVTVGPIPSTYKQLASTTTATSESIVLGDTAYDNNGNLITGELEFITYYTGTTTPSNSLGSNGDIYLQS